MSQQPLDEKQFRALIEKYLNGTATQREKRSPKSLWTALLPKMGQWMEEISGCPVQCQGHGYISGPSNQSAADDAMKKKKRKKKRRSGLRL